MVEETSTSHLPLADGLKSRIFPLRSSVTISQFVRLQAGAGSLPPPATAAASGTGTLDGVDVKHLAAVVVRIGVSVLMS